MVTLRDAVLRDAGAWADVVRAASPHHVLDERSAAHEMATDPPDVRRAVMEVDGHVVAIARSRTYAGEDHVSVLVMVHPSHRRRGVGRTLLDQVTDGVEGSGKDRLVTIVEDDADSRAAADRWGFAIVRRLRQSMVDPRTVNPPGTPAPGLDVVPLTDVGPEQVWQVHQLVARDDPSGLTLPVPWADWLAEWGDPRVRADLGRAILVDGHLAAYSMLGTAADRAWSVMTGTLPERRGHSLALLAKRHVLHAAAGAGITRAFTGNNDANLPMLAVNDRLGYVAVAHPAVAERPVE